MAEALNTIKKKGGLRQTGVGGQDIVLAVVQLQVTFLSNVALGCALYVQLCHIDPLRKCRLSRPVHACAVLQSSHLSKRWAEAPWAGFWYV